LCEYYSFELNITKYKKELKWISHYELKWQNKYDDVALCRTTNIKKLYDVVTSMAINEKKKNENSYINQKLFKCKIKEVPINSNDFLVRTNLFRCYYKEHLVEEIIGVVKIVTPKGDIREERVSCAYCPNCYCFYILNSQYDNLRKIGIILCQLIDKEDYYKFGKLNEFNVAKESLLMQNRYNVKANNGMTDIQLKIILKNIIDNKILSAHRISSYLDMFISQKKSMPQYSEAIQKWESDKRFVLEYKSNDKRIVNIDSIKII
jgi:hypothetical protein